MDSLFQAPVATAFDAASSFVSAGAYLAVGFAAVAYAPKDLRARMFLAVALASSAPYGITTLMWFRGSAVAISRPVIIVTALSLMLGSVALLHFTQVFPWRRPWIRVHGRWLIAGYAIILAVTASAAWLTRGIEFTGSGGLGAVSAGPEIALVLLLVVLPVIFILGIVTPFAGLFSLYKSWLAAKAAGIEAARVTTFWMLISQMAGGVLTILIVPLLHLVAPTGPWVTIAAALLFGFGLLMPVAFAVGIWKLRLLDLEIDGLPQDAKRRA
jgi:hypothetical protein